MNLRARVTVLAIGAGLFLVPAKGATKSGDAEFFEMRIRPLLAKNCYACHTHSKMGGLQLDSRENAVRGGNSGPSIRPGNAAGSILIQAVSYTHDRLKMPPTGKLADEEVADLKTWIDAGAVWPETGEAVIPATETAEYVIAPEQRAFWSFQPVEKPALPKVKDEAWPRMAADHFILAKLEQEGLEPAPQADKRALIRRATFDLIGLPPTPEDIQAFLSDDSSEAFSKVVDRLLASPHYGERWGRYWLDLARYADGKLGTKVDDPYPNAYRYRDWVIGAFNDDLPYDTFIRAQLAADLFPEEERDRMLPALGFHALAPRGDDRVDVTARTFLALTVGCAECHDHKYDPIPTKDFYSLQGVFESSEDYEYPLAPEEEVDAYKKAQKRIGEKKEAIQKFIETQSQQLADIFFEQTSRYMVAAWKVITGAQAGAATAAEEADLDSEVVERWVKYLRDTEKEHSSLKEWDDMMARGGALEEARALADKFQKLVLAVNLKKKEIEDRNYVKLGGAKGVADERTRQYTNLEFLDLMDWYLWRDLASEPHTKSGFEFDGGVFYYGARNGMEIDRFLSGAWKKHLDRLRAELEQLEEALPPAYPFIHGYRESEKPKDIQVRIRGDRDNLGEVAPRRFLRILSHGEPELFTKGSGRWELAAAIAGPDNPLTARVMVNRMWQHHFGAGIVRTASNFGRLGERPTHPELLDYLAARFIESGWSIKAMHREMMLSSAYRLSAQHLAKNFEKDPGNSLLWRMNLTQRLDAEALRDAVLTVSGSLDRTIGGPPVEFDDKNQRRAIYGLVSRTQPNRAMTLFDFPDPNSTSENRIVTVGPMQRLYFLNSSFVMDEARALAARLEKESGGDDEAKIRRAYELLYGRLPTQSEIKLGLEYLRQAGDAWPKYAQVLLASSEFSSVN